MTSMMEMNMLVQRGRKGGTTRFTVVPGGKRATLPSPNYFGEEERKLWHQIVRSVGADYFSPATRPLLEQFVVLSIAGRKPDLSQKERVAVSLCITRLASTMRLLPSYERPKRKPAPLKPIWET
jgi:hypothetical protein